MAEKKEKQYVSDNAQLMAEWDWEKNTDISPYETTIGSRVNVYWLGKCGHSWDAIIKDRARGYGCPICAGKRVIEGVNDFKSNYPEISSQWHYEKNHPLLPSMVASKSHKQVWWICNNGHEYISSIDNRTRGRNCPYCTSKIVTAGKNDLLSQEPFLSLEYSSLNEISPNAVFAHSHQKVWWKCSKCNHLWKATIDSRTRGNGCPMCSARTQSSFPEQALYYYIKSKHSDAISRFTDTSLGRYELDIFVPSLAMGIEYDGKHWHSSESSQQKEVKKFEACKTLGITLVRVRESCEKTEGIADHLIYVTNDINATIKELIPFGLVASDINVERDRYDIMSCYLGTLNERSFASKHPILANEWCYDKNGDLTPDMFSEFSTQAKFWWKCSKGHIWQSTIAHRTSMNSNCPYCSNRKLLIGYNDLNTLFPNIAIEWHPIKNGELRPTMVMSGSKKKAWWKCSLCGHEWFTSIQTRTRGTNCPECAKQKRKKEGT